MRLLKSTSWEVKYSTENGYLVDLFYIPALEGAVRYDRLTGYFSARALILAIRGIEALCRNDGRMRLIVGCTLDEPEVEAINKGENLRRQVENHLIAQPLDSSTQETADGLELLAWMVAKGILEVKIAVPLDSDGRAATDGSLFHEKTGIIEDEEGDRIAWTGSLNETARGWKDNYETINVNTSWDSLEHVTAHEDSFESLWADNMKRAKVMSVPDAVRQRLLKFQPKKGLPKRLIKRKSEFRNRVWKFIQEAASRSNGGEQVGESTSAVKPWPHQVGAFDRMYGGWPPRLLIADEVGLGKTIQAGMLLRQAWLSGHAKRILILAPKAVLRQWQIEMREKFNLNWPIYAEGKLSWYRTPISNEISDRRVCKTDWYRQPVVFASSQLVRTNLQAQKLIDNADPWDLIVLDEAHHARRSAAASRSSSRPNMLLKLMSGLQHKTKGLVLLTATPMQVDPIEVWDLLELLGLPKEWTSEAFLQFFRDVESANPEPDAMERMAALFRSTESAFGKMESERAMQLTGLSLFRAYNTLKALRASVSIQRRQLDDKGKQAALKIMRAETPIKRLVTRNTRELLRGYFKRGMMEISIADRDVRDKFLELSAAESHIYGAVEDYISRAFSAAANKRERNAVGFVMTIYRRRLASSFFALKQTLIKRRNAIESGFKSDLFGLDEDLRDDEVTFEFEDNKKARELEKEALENERLSEIDDLLQSIRQLPPDSKSVKLKSLLRELLSVEFQQLIVFTQYTDTMDFLRDELKTEGRWRLLCFSGRGGEHIGSGGDWETINRDDVKHKFQAKEADVLLCTEAAAEGLNFQFCGAMINYDMPWNPMRVEQRIGRIDRLGQEHKTIRILNLHYEGTVESDIYRVLRERIGLFTSVVGPLQPILSRLPERISKSVLEGDRQGGRKRKNLINQIRRETQEFKESTGFDLSVVADNDLVMPNRPQPLLTMDELDRVINSRELMGSDIEIKPMSKREYSLKTPKMRQAVRVTTNPEYYEAHSDSVHLWSPGSSFFTPPEDIQDTNLNPQHRTLKEILDAR